MEGERWLRDAKSFGEIREAINMLDIDGVRVMQYLFQGREVVDLVEVAWNDSPWSPISKRLYWL